MKTCPKCRRMAGPQTMVCQCGHSYVGRPAPALPGGKLPGDLGCFVWMFLANALWAALLAALCFATVPIAERMGETGGRAFGWFFLLTSAVSLVEVVGLLQRRKFAYNLGMVICWTSFLNLPVGTILTFILMTGLSKQRQWLER